MQAPLSAGQVSAARSPATTHPIESCPSTVERVARNVKRWHGGDQPLHWIATGSLEAERRNSGE